MPRDRIPPITKLALPRFRNSFSDLISIQQTVTPFDISMIEGVFGNISYFKIKIGDNVTTSGLNCIAPGVIIGDNSYLLPLAGAPKYNVLKGDNYYFGAPLRKIFKKKVMEYLNVNEEDLEKDSKLKEKYQKVKEELEKI